MIFLPAVHPPDSTRTVGNNGSPLWFIFNNDRLLVKRVADSLGLPEDVHLQKLHLAVNRTHFLGTLDGRYCYAGEVEGTFLPESDYLLSEMRPLAGTMNEDLFSVASRAFQILVWDKNHQYCGRCGAKISSIENERAKYCPACDLYVYPRISPVVITAVLKEKKILLAHNKRFPPGMYSLIAGFVEPGEKLEETVAREIKEEVNIDVQNIRYFGSQPWPFPHSLMIGFIAEYLRGEILPDKIEITDARWFEAVKLPQLPMKGSISRKIIDWYLDI
ncbi:MAG: NAD(+) diphosphatase [Spirochaetota bacterium]